MTAALAVVIIGIALIAVIVIAIYGRSGLAPGQASISWGRFVRYLVLLGLMIVVAFGLAGLLARALDHTTPLEPRGSSDVLLSWALVLVGAPLLVAMSTWIRRRLDAETGERRSLGWAFYLSVSQLLALAAVMVASFDILL